MTSAKLSRLDGRPCRLSELAREPSKNEDRGAVRGGHHRSAASPPNLVTGRQFLPSCGVLVTLLMGPSYAMYLPHFAHKTKVVIYEVQ